MISFDMEECARVLWVGVGCQRGVSQDEIGEAIEWVFDKYDLDLATIAGLATLDRKADEVGLVDYCCEFGWFLKIYSLERLNSVPITQPSTVVANFVGSASIAEAAAMCAARSPVLLIPKQKFRLNSQSGYVTIAISVNSDGDRENSKNITKC